MNVDKWTQCGQFLLINGPSAVNCVILDLGWFIWLYYCTGWVLDSASRTKETLFDFC